MLKPSEFADTEVVTKKAGRKGGGKFGAAVLGTVGGVVGGLATGGTGAISGAAAGASLGTMIGEGIRPTVQGSSAIERRAALPVAPPLAHSETSEQLKQSLLALRDAPQDARMQYGRPLFEAYLTSLGKDNSKGVA